MKLTGLAAVDTGFSVSTTWHGPSGVLSSGSGIIVSSPVLEDGKYKSLARITSLQSSDTGTYTCTAIVSPDPPSTYVIASVGSSDQSNIDVGKFEMIKADFKLA